MTERTGPLEPTPELLAGDSPGKVARRLWMATRPQFLTASVLPVLVGSAFGFAASGRLDAIAFVLAVLATACVQAASNVLNDVGDEVGGSDPINDSRIYPFTGGSRFIQNGVMDVRQMARWGTTLLAISVVLGAALVAHSGLAVLGFGLCGIAFGLAYSIPPVQLSGRGVGEAMIAVAFGVLPVSGAYWLQSGTIDASVVLLSVPVSLWVAAILLINEVPDIDADRSASKRTLPVALGVRATRHLYVALHAGAFLAIALLTATAALAVWAPLFAVVLALLAWRASAGIDASGDGARAQLTASIRSTLAIHALGCGWLIAAILWHAFT